MISRQEATEQVEWFQSLPGYPRSDDRPKAMAGLIAAMCTAETLAHAQAGTREILDTFKRCPVPADIRENLNAIRDQYRNSALQVTCGVCDGHGWLYGKENGSGPFAHVSYSTAKRCPCGASTR